MNWHKLTKLLANNHIKNKRPILVFFLCRCMAADSIVDLSEILLDFYDLINL